MYNKVIIIGAGLSGSIMYNVLGHKAMVVESSPPATKAHRAVMRFRDPELGRLLDVKLKPVNVQKSIFYRGEHHNNGNLMFSNLYSRKTLDILATRSVGDLTERKRWILAEDCCINHTIIPEDNLYGATVKRIDKDNIYCAVGNDPVLQKLDYDVIISTLPLSLLLKLLGEELTVELVSAPIWVYRAQLPKGFSAVCQTIYFPELYYPVYRATLEEDQVIIEAIKECDDLELDISLQVFGLDFKYADLANRELIVQKYGKIKPISIQERKLILYAITDKYNIYSLGRFALWANLKSDEIFKDAMKIKEFITSPDISRKYFVKKKGAVNESGFDEPYP